MLTPAAGPEAWRNRRPSSATIQQPSPREATGKVFLKWRGKRPGRVSMRYPGMNCNRGEKRASAISTNLSRGEARLRRQPLYWIRRRNVTSSLVLQDGVLHGLSSHVV